eukprot:TRINITY_DN15793_c0_g1_i1.p1 TRINITY_DN15793_c0_g1~~TRINITY_DN15793_c0_g1_i1.p1  ORF type:complete len:694 (+),score=148.11 TRINITY_DN15793_c0_g1_i1:1071-3152(+)
MSVPFYFLLCERVSQSLFCHDTLHEAMPGASGASSAQAVKLNAAVSKVFECARDSRKFVNESEPVLAEFKRAVDQVHRQKFSDEAAIFSAIGEKEVVVHFLMDCVRNRFLLWHNVGEVKQVLTDSSKPWSDAFKRHVASCPSCRTVDLRRPAPPPAPVLRWPIPFPLELLALLGLAFPLLALGQGCDCRYRPWLLALGLLLLLPWLAFEGLWRYRRARILARFVAGSYAAKMQRHASGFFWRPSQALYVDAPPAPAPPKAARGRAEEQEEATESSCVSFGEWHKSQPRALAKISFCREATGSSSDSDASMSAVAVEQGRGGYSGSSSSDSETVVERWRLGVSCASQKWDARAAFLKSDGNIEGLGNSAIFDGDSIVFEGKTDVWVKLGYWRLDWFRKTLVSLAAFGALMALSAVALAPGLVTNCIPFSESTEIPTPLEAYFVVDSSYSVGDGWPDELSAANAIIQGFEDTYSGRIEDLYVGAGQFSSDAVPEVELTNVLADAKTAISAIQVKAGSTRTDLGLQMCQEKLGAFKSGASNGVEPFQVCILITDGTPDDQTEAVRASRAVLKANVSIMGILVGSSSGSQLQEVTSCSVWKDPTPCPWYIEFKDWSQLSTQAKQIASEITSKIETTVVTAAPYECELPYWTLSTLICVLPAVAWWIYLHCFRPKPFELVVHQDPDRLKAAGANPDRR